MVAAAIRTTFAQETEKEALAEWSAVADRLRERFERLNREIKRRTNIASIFPNEKAIIRQPSRPPDNPSRCGHGSWPMDLHHTLGHNLAHAIWFMVSLLNVRNEAGGIARGIRKRTDRDARES
jgi:Transposase, Mutator family